MKSILEQLKAAKEVAESEINAMKSARSEYEEFEENNQYPVDADVEVRLAYIDKRESLQKAAAHAEKRARCKVTSYGDLIGVNVQPKQVDCERKIIGMFGTLNYYYDEIAYRVSRIVDTYNEYNH